VPPGVAFQCNAAPSCGRVQLIQQCSAPHIGNARPAGSSKAQHSQAPPSPSPGCRSFCTAALPAGCQPRLQHMQQCKSTCSPTCPPCGPGCTSSYTEDIVLPLLPAVTPARASPRGAAACGARSCRLHASAKAPVLWCPAVHLLPQLRRHICTCYWNAGGLICMLISFCVGRC
jgi:hypothetical protein